MNMTIFGKTIVVAFMVLTPIFCHQALTISRAESTLKDNAHKLQLQSPSVIRSVRDIRYEHLNNELISLKKIIKENSETNKKILKLAKSKAVSNGNN